MSLLSVVLAFSSVAMVGCSGGSESPGGGGGGAPAPSNAVEWEKVPSDFAPREETVNVSVTGTKLVSINLFSFDDDVRVEYRSDFAPDQAQLKLYTVAKNARYSLSGVDLKKDRDRLEINKYGTYVCSIRIVNRQITELEGACYVRAVLTLPAAAEIEVSNVGQLISRRFFPITNADFLKRIDSVSSRDKASVIDEFLESYRVTSKTPSLTSSELGVVIDEFSFREEKFSVLRKLHSLVSDRPALAEMIEDVFSHFEREEARRIVGLL